MSEEAETGQAPVIEPTSAVVAAAELTIAAHTVWHWYNTEVAGKVSSVATLNDADAHLRETLPLLIAALESKG